MTVTKKFSPGDKVILAYPECDAHKEIEDFIGYVEEAYETECTIYKDDPEEGFWVKNSEIELIQKASVVAVSKSQVTPVKSDGGSSSYYDILLPNWFVDLIVERTEGGKSRSFMKTEELIEVLFKSDFDYANIQKALVRSFGAQNGAGKEGNDVDYEQNKIQYSSNRIKERAKR